MATQIDIYRQTDKEISFLIGPKGDFDGALWKSTDSSYLFSCGLYFKNPDNEDDDGTPSIALICSGELLYRKKVSYECIHAAIVLQNGSAIFYTEDDELIGIDNTGKQLFKKEFGVFYDENSICLTEDAAYIFGSDENDVMKYIIFTYETKKKIEKIIHNLAYTDEKGNSDEYSASDSIFLRFNRGFLLMYDDKKTSIMYDFLGNKITPTHEELSIIINKIEERDEWRRQEKERRKKYRKSQPRPATPEEIQAKEEEFQRQAEEYRRQAEEFNLQSQSIPLPVQSQESKPKKGLFSKLFKK